MIGVHKPPPPAVYFLQLSPQSLRLPALTPEPAPHQSWTGDLLGALSTVPLLSDHELTMTSLGSLISHL